MRTLLSLPSLAMRTAAAAILACAAVAQTAPLQGQLEPVAIASGSHANPTPVEGVVWQGLVMAPRPAPWIRVYFQDVELGEGSYLRIASLRDGDVQRLDRKSLAQWENSTAYFNGNSVLVELVAGPNTSKNLVNVGSILVGDVALSDTQGDLHFFRFARSGRLVTGGALVFHTGHETRLRRRIGARLARVFPQVGAVEFDHLWHGYVGITADRMPHLHELAPGVVAWVGCQGRGVALATILGREFARWVDTRSAADLPLPLAPLRPIPAHGFARRIARSALLLYRWRDRRG